MDIEIRKPAALARRYISLDSWKLVISYAQDLRCLSQCSKELLAASGAEARGRVLERFRLVQEDRERLLSEIGPKDFLRALSLPPQKSAAIPCVRVSLAGEIRAHLFLTADGVISEFNDRLRVLEKNRSTYIFAVVSEHAIETTFSLTDAFRGALLRRCGLFAFETEEDSSVMKRIEVRWRGEFNSRIRLFGVPLIIYVPRVVDRLFVHVEVFKRVSPFLRHASSVASPPYTLTAYNINALGVVNEVAFTADYMLLDSQMHATSEQFCLVVDFGKCARESVCFDMFGDESSSALPYKSAKIISSILDRDCGVRML
jgi:hypothetical protein